MHPSAGRGQERDQHELDRNHDSRAVDQDRGGGQHGDHHHGHPTENPVTNQNDVRAPGAEKVTKDQGGDQADKRGQTGHEDGASTNADHQFEGQGSESLVTA